MTTSFPRRLVSKETVVLRRWGRETQILDLSTELAIVKKIESWCMTFGALACRQS